MEYLISRMMIQLSSKMRAHYGIHVLSDFANISWDYAIPCEYTNMYCMCVLCMYSPAYCRYYCNWAAWTRLWRRHTVNSGKLWFCRHETTPVYCERLLLGYKCLGSAVVLLW